MQNHKEIFSSLGVLARYNIVSNWKGKDELTHPEGIGLVKKDAYFFEPPSVIFFKRDGKFMYSFRTLGGSGDKILYNYSTPQQDYDTLEECIRGAAMNHVV